MKIKGWIPDHKDERDILFSISIFDRFKSIKDEIDLRDKMSPIEDQKQTGSCVANATVGALEYLENINKELFIDYSRLFAYWNARVLGGYENSDCGCQIRNCIKGLVNLGICSETTWPFVENNVCIKPSDNSFIEAEKKQLIQYERINNSHDVDYALNLGYPVIFGIILFSSFMDTKADGIVKSPNYFEKRLGGHGMLACGKTIINKNKHYIVRNSWSENWGDKGYCYIPAKYFDRYASDMWMLKKVEGE